MFMTIGEDISQGFKIEQPYFEQTEPMTWEDEGSYIEADESSEKSSIRAITSGTMHSVKSLWP